MKKIITVVKNQRWYRYTKQIKILISQILSSRIGYIIYLHFIDSEDIKILNFKHRKKNKSTDVLSFPMDNNEDDDHCNLGDICFSFNDIMITKLVNYKIKQTFLNKCKVLTIDRKSVV